MNQLDLDYQNLLKDILENGVEKETRNGKTLSVFGRNIRYKFKDGKFPLLTTKKMAFKTMVTELLWFLKGDTNIKYLVDNNCHIWDGDCFANYKRKINLQNNWEVTLRTMDVDTIGQQELLSQEEFINKIKTDDEFANKWGDLGPVYGKQWRRWNKVRFRDIQRINQHPTQIMGVENPFEEEGKWVRGYEDQIANLISELKTNPDSRRLMVNAWNVGELDQMVLPPCHYGFQVYTRELSYSERLRLVNYDKEKFTSVDEWIKWYENEPNEFYYGGINYTKETALTDLDVPTRAISLMYNTRSQDVPLGTPFNIASYALLLEIIAKEVNMVPDELITNMGDCHIYLNQIEGIKEQLTREPYPLPKLKILDSKVDDIAHYEIGDFIIEGYQSHPAIKIPLSN
jgi:thymidylate synthase